MTPKTESMIHREAKGTPAGGRFAPSSHAEPETVLAGNPEQVTGTKIGGVEDYRMGHRAPTNDGYCNPIDRLADSFADDVYEHPEYHGGGECDEETMRQLLAARNNPDATVRIYRALPPGLGDINSADWITLSEDYAREHAIQDSDPGHDWPVVHADVPARTVFSDGNDLSEFGYDGPALAGLPDHSLGGTVSNEESAPANIAPPVPGIWAHRTVHFHAAHNAIVDETARQQLKDDFDRAGLSYEQLAEAVGHAPQISRRIVEGKEFLNETTVAMYFEALGHQPSIKDVDDYEADQVTIRRMDAAEA